MKKIAILQSNYIPWKGVFDLINSVDEFVFYDDVQFTKRDWRSRNQIKTRNGLAWLSVPVITHGKFNQKINEAVIDNSFKWQESHYKTICHSYANAPYFEKYKHIIESIYLDSHWSSLSSLNKHVIQMISDELGINTNFVESESLYSKGEKEDRLIDICIKLGANEYVSGPAGKNYINEQKFIDANIKLTYFDYEYPRYPQLFGEFEHYVSILDVLFNCGDSSQYYIWGWKANGGVESDKL